ncbi:hypothetical protein SK1NUM_03960 [Arachnia rubra]|nr:hypothetical protein SK1NUM_03960 [Arachnia rubra]
MPASTGKSAIGTARLFQLFFLPMRSGINTIALLLPPKRHSPRTSLQKGNTMLRPGSAKQSAIKEFSRCGNTNGGRSSGADPIMLTNAKPRQRRSAPFPIRYFRDWAVHI